MNERIGASFRLVVAAIMSCGLLVIVASLIMISRGMVFDGLVLAGAAAWLLRWYWQATARKRRLVARGFHAGRRVGNHWAYEELHDGVVVSLELPLEYAGRGEYELHIPAERDWSTRMPPWARQRRAEIAERIGTVFKRSQIHFDPDAGAAPDA